MSYSLGLSTNYVLKDGGQFLAEEIKLNTAVKQLDLSHKVFSEALKENSVMQQLDRFSSGISNSGAELLLEALKAAPPSSCGVLLTLFQIPVPSTL